MEAFVVLLKSRLTDRLADRPKVLADSTGGYLIIGGLQEKMKISKMYTYRYLVQGDSRHCWSGTDPTWINSLL